MFKSALEIAQVTQTSQASWATTWLNLGTSLRKLGKLDEAREAYVKVLEIDSRSAPALGFLGLIYHLMDRLDDAIVKYHEVRLAPSQYLVTTRFPPRSPRWGVLTRTLLPVRVWIDCRPCRSILSMPTCLSYSTSHSKRALTPARSRDSGRAEGRSGRIRCARKRRLSRSSGRRGRERRRPRRHRGLCLGTCRRVNLEWPLGRFHMLLRCYSCGLRAIEPKEDGGDGEWGTCIFAHAHLFVSRSRLCPAIVVALRAVRSEEDRVHVYLCTCIHCLSRRMQTPSGWKITKEVQISDGNCASDFGRTSRGSELYPAVLGSQMKHEAAKRHRFP
jgi:Tetratricopeptide repeat